MQCPGAHSFVKSYMTMVHPLYPVYDKDSIQQSIEQRFAGGVRYDDDRMEFMYPDLGKKFDHSRDLLVLALVGSSRKGKTAENLFRLIVG
jgi:hypothetical protein